MLGQTGGNLPECVFKRDDSATLYKNKSCTSGQNSKSRNILWGFPSCFLSLQSYLAYLGAFHTPPRPISLLFPSSPTLPASQSAAYLSNMSQTKPAGDPLDFKQLWEGSFWHCQTWHGFRQSWRGISNSLFCCLCPFPTPTPSSPLGRSSHGGQKQWIRLSFETSTFWVSHNIKAHPHNTTFDMELRFVLIS